VKPYVTTHRTKDYTSDYLIVTEHESEHAALDFAERLLFDEGDVMEVNIYKFEKRATLKRGIAYDGGVDYGNGNALKDVTPPPPAPPNEHLVR
jgi:hypothetical protein